MSETSEIYGCPCDNCDRETLLPDEVCVTCMEAGCNGYEVRCS